MLSGHDIQGSNKGKLPTLLPLFLPFIKWPSSVLVSHHPEPKSRSSRLSLEVTQLRVNICDSYERLMTDSFQDLVTPGVPLMVGSEPLNLLKGLPSFGFHYDFLTSIRLFLHSCKVHLSSYHSNSLRSRERPLWQFDGP